MTEHEEPIKKIEKHFACRICGTRYCQRQEADECRRGHEWQNRKGRR